MTKRRIAIAAVTVVAAVALALLVLALFPWGALRGTIERQASARFGRPVTIGAIDRLDPIGFHPTIAIRDIVVPQPAWVVAGRAGTERFATIRAVRLHFSVWPLLRGHFTPQDVVVDGARLTLVRAVDGHTNWSRPDDGRDASSRGATDLRDLTITDALVRYRDAKQDRAADLRVAADARHGVSAVGAGIVRGARVTISVHGAPIATGETRWPFSARIAGPALAMTATGAMDHPFDIRHLSADVTARAADLKLIDAVIEAGLFETRAVVLHAHVRHDGDDWHIPLLSGTIGRSDFAGTLTVGKVDGRTQIAARIDAGQVDFDDLSSPAGRAKAAAREQAVGPRLVPDTQIDIGKIATTDGRIAFRIGRVVSDTGGSSVHSAAGVLTLDHRLLRIDPVSLHLSEGVVSGHATIDQRGGRPQPILSVDLTLRDGDVLTMAGGGGAFTGRIVAHARLIGTGETVRAAVGRADGRIGLVVRDGTLPERYAAAMGFDAGRALLAGNDRHAGLRCLILGVRMHDGHGTIDPLVVDTTQSQLHGTGTVGFPGEQVDLRLTGAPKHGALLRLSGTVTLTGSIQRPHLDVPPAIRSAGNILKAIGRRITGRNGPEATDADCARLSAAVLR